MIVFAKLLVVHRINSFQIVPLILRCCTIWIIKVYSGIEMCLLLFRDVKLGFFLKPKLDCSKPNINRSSKYSG